MPLHFSDGFAQYLLSSPYPYLAESHQFLLLPCLHPEVHSILSGKSVPHQEEKQICQTALSSPDKPAHTLWQVSAHQPLGTAASFLLLVFAILPAPGTDRVQMSHHKWSYIFFSELPPMGQAFLPSAHEAG